MFAYHAFISYAHIDNLPLDGEPKGWICKFHDNFRVYLATCLGDTPRIWRDIKLQENDIFSEEIKDALCNSTLFILIRTPRYVKSEWCRREVQEFCHHAKSNDGLILDNKSRLIQVFKMLPEDHHVAEKVLPDVVSKSLGYNFDQLDPVFGQSYKEKYLLKIHTLASHAALLIKQVEAVKAEAKAAGTRTTNDGGSEASSDQETRSATSHTSNEPPQSITDVARPAVAKKTVVFLASCSFDQRDQRELIEADLRSHGYRVLPEQRLPGDDEAEHRQAVAALLEQAHFSLHLIGAHYGAVPDGPSHLSQAEIQNTMAAERSASHGMSRLIWLPQSTTSDDLDHGRFLESLRRQQGPQQGADLLSGSFQELRTELHACLDRIEAPPPPPPSPPEEAGGEADPVAPGAADGLTAATRMIYLICVAEDRPASQPLRKWLKAQGWEVILPAFVGDAAALRNTHECQLRDCHAVVLFYGAGDEAWQRSVALDLRRAPAYRNGAPLPPPFTYLAAPDSHDKQDMLEMENAHLLDGRQGFDPALLHPFLQSLHTAAARP